MSQGNPQITIAQDLKVSQYSENKRQNLIQASNHIQAIVIQPGQIFSFWTLVGEPSARNGYLPGRTLVNGVLQAEMGGGLCQLSGILYYLALQAGLKIIERYPHSVDIYTEETRFTPLGSDATVVYGYKDLRFQNCLSHPIYFEIEIWASQFIGHLCAVETIQSFQIDFESQPSDTQIQVDTYQIHPETGQRKHLDVSYYRKPTAAQTAVAV